MDTYFAIFILLCFLGTSFSEGTSKNIALSKAETENLAGAPKSAALIQDFNTTDDYCHAYTCANGGSCYMSGNSTECYCLNGFSGDDCTISPCAVFNCGAGICVTNAKYFTFCMCFDGSLYSKYCDPCRLHNCGNGTCIDRGNGGKYCKCDDETLEASYCNPCDRSPCQFPASCYENQNSLSGYTCWYAGSGASSLKALVLIPILLCILILLKFRYE